ncbi:group 1 glycosyl transferase, partial [Thauera phenylacetica B4P]
EWADGVMAGRLAALYRRLLAAPQAAPPVRAARIVSTR